MVTSIAGGIDHKATAEQIEHIATLIPDEWLESSADGIRAAVRGPHPQGVRLWRRRADHARRDPRRTRAHRHGLPRRREGACRSRAVSGGGCSGDGTGRV